jgi:hypothetical protein
VSTFPQVEVDIVELDPLLVDLSKVFSLFVEVTSCHCLHFPGVFCAEGSEFRRSVEGARGRRSQFHSKPRSTRFVLLEQLSSGLISSLRLYQSRR